MRYITVPQEITVLDPVTDVPVKRPDPKFVGPEANAPKIDWTISFKEFVCGRLLIDATHFGANAEALLAAADISALVRGAKVGEVFGMETELWNRLMKSLNEPSIPFNTPVHQQLCAFIRAIRNAPDKKEAKSVLVAAV